MAVFHQVKLNVEFTSQAVNFSIELLKRYQIYAHIPLRDKACGLKAHNSLCRWVNHNALFAFLADCEGFLPGVRGYLICAAH